MTNMQKWFAELATERDELDYEREFTLLRFDIDLAMIMMVSRSNENPTRAGVRIRPCRPHVVKSDM